MLNKTSQFSFNSSVFKKITSTVSGLALIVSLGVANISCENDDTGKEETPVETNYDSEIEFLHQRS